MYTPPKVPNNFNFTKEQWFQIFITFIVVGSTLIGVIIGGWQASGAYEQQQKKELENIAQALYYEVSGIEDLLNYSLNHSASKPNYVHVIYVHYYDDNGLYYDFRKEISKFDSETSKDMYDFYGFIISLDDEQEILLSATRKRLNEGNVTDYEFIQALETMDTLRAAIPDGIKKANKVKKELIQKYHVNTTVMPGVISYHPSQTYTLQGGSVEYIT